MNQVDLLKNVKEAIAWGNFQEALKPLEKLLTLIKFDYDTGLDRDKNAKAFNALAKVRKELKEGKLSDESYRLLKLNPPRKAEEASPKPKEEPKIEKPVVDEKPKEEPKPTPEEKALESKGNEYQFHWDDIPTVTFEDIAGLDECKAMVERKVILPLLHPEMLEGYVNGGGGGVCLYGPPGTGKTMISAAIANRIGAKFCSITPSDLLQQGQGNTEKAVKALFAEARSFPCAVIYFDEMDSIAPKSTRSTGARQLRSEFLAQLQGVASYGKKSKNILFLICATNKPWDIDSAFLRPGRFGTKIYVGLPDEEARRYIITHHLDKLKEKGLVEIKEDIDVDYIVDKTNGFNCADVSNLLNLVEEVSLARLAKTKEKYIGNADFLFVLRNSVSSVQAEDIERLAQWRKENDAPISLEEEEEELPAEPAQEEATSDPTPTEEPPAGEDNSEEKEN